MFCVSDNTDIVQTFLYVIFGLSNYLNEPLKEEKVLVNFLNFTLVFYIIHNCIYNIKNEFYLYFYKCCLANMY